MKKLLLLPALLCCSAAFAQTATNCAAIKAENEALKEKVVAYEARLGIGVEGVKIANGDEQVKVMFLSCKASKATHKAVFSFMLTNSDVPTKLSIVTYGPTATAFYDEQGHGYPASFAGVRVGSQSNENMVSPKTPVQCSVRIENLPLGTTRFNTVFLALHKEMPGVSKLVDFKTALTSVPITWVP
jgi:hypothetical protein